MDERENDNFMITRLCHVMTYLRTARASFTKTDFNHLFTYRRRHAHSVRRRCFCRIERYHSVTRLRESHTKGMGSFLLSAWLMCMDV